MTVKRAFIAAHKALYPVRLLCAVLGIARSWVYGFARSQPARDRRTQERAQRDAELLPKIKAAFLRSKKRYGSKRIYWDLRAGGEHVSERAVAKIMRKNNISPQLRKRRKPQTTNSNHTLKPSPNLLARQFESPAPNRVWLADITYIDTDEGWLYVAAIKEFKLVRASGSKGLGDLLKAQNATREIVGWAMEDHMREELCVSALKMALGRRNPAPGLLHHSDRGRQYAGGWYRRLLNSKKITQSMSRTGECLDNAPMESFFASLKKELIHQTWLKTRAEAKTAIFEYIEVFYNRQRRHSAIGYQTPAQAFEAMTWQNAA